MKSNSKVLGGILLAATLLLVGCQTKTPPLAATAATPDQFDLITFTSPTNVQINTSLPVVYPGKPLGSVTVGSLGALLSCDTFISYPTSIVDPTGQLMINGASCGGPIGCSPTGPGGPGNIGVDVEPSGLSNYPYEIHMTAWIDDPESSLYLPGPGNYDSVYFRVWPGYASLGINDGSYVTPASTYDVSPYSGLQFYIKVASYDNAIVKQLEIYTPSSNHGTPAGECQSPGDPNDIHCYDPFYYDWSAIPRDQWVLVEKLWTDFKAYGNGSIPNPPTLSGTNLQEIDWFGFVEGNGALPGPVTCDYAVTGVKFF